MFCTTECWSCNDKSCEHYIDKTKLYFDYKKLLVENQKLKEKINHLLIDLNGESEYKIKNKKAIERLNIIDFDNFVYTKRGLKDIKIDLLNILQ